MRKFHKRGAAALGIGVVVLGLAGAAFAYWTQSGSGTGGGTVGTAGTLTLTGTVAPGLYPDGEVQVTLKATNGGTSAVTVGTVHLDGVTTNNTGCLGGDFTMADVPQTAVVGANTSAAPLNPGTLKMANTSLNQDACKNASLTLALSSV